MKIKFNYFYFLKFKTLFGPEEKERRAQKFKYLKTFFQIDTNRH